MTIEMDRFAKQFAGLVSAIENHNSKHSASATAMEGLMGVIFSALGPKENKVEPPPNPQQSADEIFSRYSGTLAALGLEIVQNRDRQIVSAIELASGKGVDSQQTGHRLQRMPDKIDLQLIEGEKLIAFLKTVSPRTAEAPGMIQAFSFLADSLDNQLIGKYVLTTRGENVTDWDEFKDAVDGVMSELNRIGAKSAAAKVGTHLERAWQGDLSEFLIADSKNLLGRYDFGPNKWHFDMNVDHYEEKWNEAIELVEQIGENERARGLFDVVLTRLKDGVEEAESSIRKILSRPGPISEYWQVRGNRFLEILQDARERLTLLKF